MNKLIEQNGHIVKELSAEVEQVKGNIMLRAAVQPLVNVVNFMRNVVKLAVEHESRLKALEEKAGVSHE
ncbi:hypothetical protein [Photobacterium halotolerans]|uniref:Uncharacterized protein n=1 Tax=Photobacterium halotolerans TaxID=265726 RepID=A0A7X4W983_9GAMM|nr:hypothetical protein [Photobacterium halotolerans]NAW64527.1 hypothetical protein [Photobacterium halotolerans]